MATASVIPPTELLQSMLACFQDAYGDAGEEIFWEAPDDGVYEHVCEFAGLQGIIALNRSIDAMEAGSDVILFFDGGTREVVRNAKIVFHRYAQDEVGMETKALWTVSPR